MYLLVAEVDPNEAAAPELLGGGLVRLHDGSGLRPLADEDLAALRIVALNQRRQLAPER